MSTDILYFIHQLEVRYPSFSIHAFQKAMDAVTEHYYHYREAKSAHPSVELFLQSFYRYHDLDVYDECLSTETRNELLAELNDVLSDFMLQLKSPRHQKQLHNLKRADKRNSDSIWLITSCRSANNIMPITVFLPAFIASFFYSA